MKNRIKVLICEPSIILANGLIATLNSISSLSIEITHCDKLDLMQAQIAEIEPDILIVNPMYLGVEASEKIKESVLRTVALQTSVIDENLLRSYNAVIGVNDTMVQIEDKFDLLVNTVDEPEKAQLSTREMEIVANIALGLSNKEIADKLFLSTHTVTTHRRNIMSKLQIHSSAGLTIYAIVNKLVDIGDVK